MMRSWLVVAASIVTASSICDPNVDQCQISAQPKDNVMLQVGKNRVAKNEEGEPGGKLKEKLKEKAKEKDAGEDDEEGGSGGSGGKLKEKLKEKAKEKAAGEDDEEGGPGGKLKEKLKEKAKEKAAGEGDGAGASKRKHAGRHRRAKKRSRRGKRGGMLKKLKILSAVKEMCFSEADKAKFKLKAKACGIDLPERGRGKKGDAALLEEIADCDKDDLKASIKEHIEACDFSEKVKAKLSEQSGDCENPSTDEQKTKCQHLVLGVLKIYKDVCVEGDFEPPPSIKEALRNCAMKHKGAHSDDENEEHVCDLSEVKEQLKGAVKECGMAEKVKAKVEEAIKAAMEAKAKTAGKLKKLKEHKESQ